MDRILTLSLPHTLQHDCIAYKKKCQQQGIEIQTRNRKGGGSKKKTAKPKAGKAAKAAVTPILTTLQANKAIASTLEAAGMLPMA